MNCLDFRKLLNAYSDGELDLVRHVELEQHLAECPHCTENEKNLRSLRSVFSSEALYHRAPPQLRDKILRATRPDSIRLPLKVPRSFPTVAGVLILIGASIMLGRLMPQSVAFNEDRFVEQVMASHIRSLQVEHAIDVASSDRHTVKPWFHGKLDFAPQVPDLSEQGFTLSGGRLDYLTDRPVAALVYYRRLHAINVISWPANQAGDKPLHRVSRQGFHLRNWEYYGMVYWVISDLNDQELDQFVNLFREESRAAESPM